MNRRSFCLISAVIFIVIALVHLIRIIYGWKVVVGPWTAPDSITWVALVVAGYLGYEGLRFARSGWLP
jgi:hypothetical protein